VEVPICSELLGYNRAKQAQSMLTFATPSKDSRLCSLAEVLGTRAFLILEIIFDFAIFTSI
jgi:hypothetical protein